jgi:hypothetical protein
MILKIRKKSGSLISESGIIQIEFQSGYLRYYLSERDCTRYLDIAFLDIQEFQVCEDE